MPILPISPIMPIIPMPLVWNLPIGTIFLLPVLSRLIHFLLDTALLQEVALLPLYKSTDKHIALMNKRNGNVGDGLVRALLYFIAIDSRVEMSFAERTGLHTSWVIISPLFQIPHTQIILVVKQ